tara:strand:+ start:460 stop:1638 length:1179 start_codon:yes stop_codon:yes gene_type:complete
MSEIKVNSIKGVGASAAAITVNNTDGTCTANVTSIGGGQLSNRNKIINGSMIVSQRGTSFASTLSEGQYTMDRFSHSIRGTNDSYYTQVSDSPNGFTKSMKVTCNSTYTPSGSDNAGFMTSLEGQDLQDFAFGTSSAKSITISFYAKSGSQNNGHQYSFQLRTHPSGGATNRIVTNSFTVTSSWQKFSFTFAGDTGADITDGNTVGIQCCWWLDAGPDDIISQINSFTSSGSYRSVTGQDHFLNNTSNEFYITGIQLEVGSVATDFEHRSYADSLDDCLRYAYVINVVDGAYIAAHTAFSKTSTTVRGNVFLPKPMRAFPSYTGTATDAFFYAQNTGSVFHLDTITSVFNNSSADRNITNFGIGVTTSSVTAGQGGQIEGQETGTMTFEAEL